MFDDEKIIILFMFIVNIVSSCYAFSNEPEGLADLRWGSSVNVALKSVLIRDNDTVKHVYLNGTNKQGERILIYPNEQYGMYNLFNVDTFIKIYSLIFTTINSIVIKSK